MYFRIRRDVVVHHRLQFLDIQTACGNVGGHQHRAALVGKTHHHLIAFTLFQIAMQGQCAVALGFQLVGDLLRLLFHVAENHGGTRLVMLQQFEQCRELGFLIRQLKEALFNLMCAVGGFHAHTQWIALEFGAQLLNILRIGCGEQQRLTLARTDLGNFAHCIGKTHVEHTVGFIQHPNLQAVEAQAFFIQMFLHTAGGTDHNVRALFQRTELRIDRHTTAQRQHFDVWNQTCQTADFTGHLIG